MKQKYRRYTDQDIITVAARVRSLSSLLRKLGLKVAGGNYDNMRRNLQRLNVDTSHWTGQAWNRDLQTKDYNQYTRATHLKPHVIRSRGHKCEMCHLEIWMNKEIMLEIHHIDGDRTNNHDDNLQLLCPNCHATTSNWRNRKR